MNFGVVFWSRQLILTPHSPGAPSPSLLTQTKRQTKFFALWQDGKRELAHVSGQLIRSTAMVWLVGSFVRQSAREWIVLRMITFSDCSVLFARLRGSMPQNANGGPKVARSWMPRYSCSCSCRCRCCCCYCRWSAVL